MYTFSSPQFLKGAFDVAIARKDGSQYVLVLPVPSGFIDNRQIAVLNYSTPPSSAPSPPRFWFDSDYDRKPDPFSSLLSALLVAEPKPPIKLTGHTQRMSAELGGEREAVEVELLLTEEELAKACYYCGEVETEWDIRDQPFKHNGGEGYASTYECASVRTFALFPYKV